MRLFYGDAETGRDWLEEHGVEGRLGRSMGPLKVPLILAPQANHGSALLDHCIVRLSVEGQDVWRHPSYHQGRFELADSGLASHPFAVEVDGASQANFKTALARQKYVDFITGAPAPAKSKTAAPLPMSALACCEADLKALGWTLIRIEPTRPVFGWRLRSLLHEASAIAFSKRPWSILRVAAIFLSSELGKTHAPSRSTHPMEGRLRAA